MKDIKFNSRTLLVLFATTVISLAMGPTVFADSAPLGEMPREGLTSYIFSPMTITVLLILALVIQIAYRHRKRSADKAPAVKYVPQASTSAKKRYDKEEMSKLLKASATRKTGARTLEEAIKLSKVLEPQLTPHLQSPEGAEAVSEPVLVEEPHLLEEQNDGQQLSEAQVVDVPDESVQIVDHQLIELRDSESDVSVEPEVSNNTELNLPINEPNEVLQNDSSNKKPELQSVDA